MLLRVWCTVIFLFIQVLFSTAFLEEGLWRIPHVQLSKEYYFIKNLFAKSTVNLQIKCSSTSKNKKFKANYLLRFTPCAEEYVEMKKLDKLSNYFVSPGYTPYTKEVTEVSYKKSSAIFDCNEKTHFPRAPDLPSIVQTRHIIPSFNNNEKNASSLSKPGGNAGGRVRRADSNPSTTLKKPLPQNTKLPNNKATKSTQTGGAGKELSSAWKNGFYLLVVQISCLNCDLKDDLQTQIEVRMRDSSYGFLSAVDWPLLIVYSVLCCVYVCLGLYWLLVSLLNWKELLRLQYCIGVVILLGTFEKAFFLAQYEALNRNGTTVIGSAYLAYFISCAKRALARMLIMIVCIGYGIVKPSLGPAIKKVCGIGALYFVCALVEAYLKIARSQFDQSRSDLYAAIPIALIDIVIVWWSFSHLVATLKQMRMRRNTVKYNLYRRFSNVLIAVIFGSIVFMALSIYSFRVYSCVKSWRFVWLDHAFWQMLFTVILIAIVLLWRPSKNSNRFAYSPLLDNSAEGDDDVDDANELMMEDMNGVELENGGRRAGGGDDDGENIIMDNMTSGEIKKTKKESAAIGRDKSKAQNGPEADLKWIEENIPASATEKVFEEEKIKLNEIENQKMD